MNFSGLGFNKAFKTGIDPKKPYYYITGSLDLSGAVYGGTYFFNFDNDFKYASQRDYANFITIDENSVISEVLVYTDPDLEAVTNVEQLPVYLSIGGADYTANAPNNAVKVWWAAPAGFGPYQYASISNIAQVSRLGGVATITTTQPHGLIANQWIDVFCSTDADYTQNGIFLSASDILSPTTFQYFNPNAPDPDALHNASGFISFGLGSNPAFFNGYPLSLDEAAKGPVNLFGHEGGHFPYSYDPVNDEINASNKYKYLAVTILDELPQYPDLAIPDAVQDVAPLPAEESKEEVIVIDEANKGGFTNLLSAARNMRKKKSAIRGLPSGDVAILQGKLTVTIKVYPKNQ